MGLLQRLAQSLDTDFHDAFVHRSAGFIGGLAVVGELKDVAFRPPSWMTISEISPRFTTRSPAISSSRKRASALTRLSR